MGYKPWLAEDIENSQYYWCVKFKLVPPIRIHVWGGLGSQLHGVALLYELLERYPNRRVVLVLHTSGVTDRSSELDDLLPTEYLSYLSDFSKESVLEASQGVDSSQGFKLGNLFRKFGKVILSWSGLYARANSDIEFEKLKPWVMSIRGHYTARSVPTWAILEIFNQAKSKGLIEFYAENPMDSGIHYRLGDLLILQTKRPTDSFKVATAVSTAHEKFNAKKFGIFSDSGNQAKAILDELCPGIDFEICEGNTWDVIGSLVAARVFIGTSSKVSEWIALFRVALDVNSQMLLPSHFQTLLQRYVLIPRDAPNVILY